MKTIWMAWLVLATGCFAASESSNWPQFRGPNGSGVADTQKPPIHFGPSSNLLWKTSLPSGMSSPCIWGDRIFLTGFENERLGTLCINRNDGKLLWRKTAPAKQIETYFKKEGSPAASTPVTDGERVYVYFGHIYAASLNGTVVVFEADSHLNVKARNRLGERVAATPAIVDNKIYIRGDNHLLAFGTPAK